ncbi:MAG: hypothetical protein SVS85_03630, partial [Candidatus Nanohaloarchaea archaeon]|nr:hypothetical protein [Candidatus Nanohaloarchaea archaeon]
IDPETAERLARERLTDALVRFIEGETADQYIEQLDSTLYHKTLDEYVQEDVHQLKEDLPVGLHQRLDEEAGRLLMGGEVSEEFRTELANRVDASDDVLEELTSMQKYLQEKSRGRLIGAIQNPDETDLSFALSSDYRIDWPYNLAVLWDAEGSPEFADRGVLVHSRLGKLASRIRRYNRKSVPKEVIDISERLGVEWDKPRYWGSSTGRRIRNPTFPISSVYEGRMYGSIIEGKTAEMYDDEAEAVSWAYNLVPTKDNAGIRENALAKLRQFGDDHAEARRYEEDLSGLQQEFDADMEDADGERLVYNFPSALQGIMHPRGYGQAGDMPEDELKEVLSDEDLAAGFVAQAVWDRGVVSGEDTIRYSPKNPELFSHAARTAGLYPSIFERENEISGVGFKIRPSHVSGCNKSLRNDLEEFVDAYQAIR